MADGDIQALMNTPPGMDPALAGVLGAGTPPAGTLPPGYYGGPQPVAPPPTTPTVPPAPNAQQGRPATQPPAAQQPQPSQTPPGWQQPQPTTQQQPPTAQHPKAPAAPTAQPTPSHVQVQTDPKTGQPKQLVIQQPSVQIGGAKAPAETYNYPPFVEAHIVMKEHSGDTEVSPKGAIGHYQVTPDTAVTLWKQYFPNAQQYTAEQWATMLMNPATNQYMGRLDIQRLWDRYKGQPDAATLVYIGYNAGQGKADEYLAHDRDPSVLPAETAAYINAPMTAGSSEYYQELHQNLQEQDRMLTEQATRLQKQIDALTPGDPKQRELADQLLEKQIQLMDNFERMMNHPPTFRPPDEMKNFGSIATLIGIFAGRFAHAPLTASLNAAGAAIEAMNQNNVADYNRAFAQWKTQADMTQTLLNMEANTYKGILDNEHLQLEEKINLIKLNSEVFQNRLMAKQAQAQDLEGLIKSAYDMQKYSDEHAVAMKRLDVLDAQYNATRRRITASQQDQDRHDKAVQEFIATYQREPSSEEDDAIWARVYATHQAGKSSAANTPSVSQQEKNDQTADMQRKWGPMPANFQEAYNEFEAGNPPGEDVIKQWPAQWQTVWYARTKNKADVTPGDQDIIDQWHTYSRIPYRNRGPAPAAGATAPAANAPAATGPAADPAKVALARKYLKEGKSRDIVLKAWMTDGGTEQQFNELFGAGTS